MKKTIFSVIAAFSLLSCGNPKQQEESKISNVYTFLSDYNSTYQKLATAASLAQWQSNTRIIEGDSSNAMATEKAEQALADFTGAVTNIEQAKAYLANDTKLSSLQKKQLHSILYKAANNPATVSDLVKARIAAETAQTEKLFGYDFKIDGKSVSTNDIDNILKTELDLKKRLKAWESSKEVGVGLKEGLLKLRDLRNQNVAALGYKNYFEYQVSDYGMTSEEMMALLKQINKEIYPLYRELHTYARYELAKKYHVKEVPDMIPAHWLSNRWGQDWSEMIEVKGLNLDSVIKSKDAEWIIKQGERYYMSMGFPALPQVFWDKSDLYPAPAGATYKKNNHASAWHMDYDKDVRSLMSIIPNAEWYETAHHELGHIYYYLSYSNPNVPILLREGANRAYHEALGSMFGFAAMQKPFLVGLGLVDSTAKIDETKSLLKEALNYLAFIPFATGTMSEFEHNFYANNLSPDSLNTAWWGLAKKYQGIEPPSKRPENYCDAATKTHINDDAAQYYDYALSYVLLFQIHDYIAKNILHQNPHATNYYGNKEIGKFIESITHGGSSEDWRVLLKDKTGSDLSAKAMLDYFNPLMTYLQKENTGRKYTLEMPQ